MNRNLVDCEGLPYPVFAVAQVISVTKVEGAKPDGSVFKLKIKVSDENFNMSVPGQFFMLRSEKSQQLLARPISVFHCEKNQNGIEITFLILLKGQGTKELCSLDAGERVQVLGPLGNCFKKPTDFSRKVLLIGGGIGVAPVSGFAEVLPEKSYDFIASFKSGFYGIENLKADKLVITTDDGSAGLKGMVSVAVDAQKIKNGSYSAVYACGPLPMLNYIKTVSEEAGVQCYLSMESIMAF